MYPDASKPLKERTTKAERRALQNAQRAEKAAARPDTGDAGGCLMISHCKIDFAMSLSLMPANWQVEQRL